MTAQPGWYTLRELAQLRACTPDYLRQRILAGLLPATKVGSVWVVSRADAQAYLATPRRRYAGRKGPRYDHFGAECPRPDHYVACNLNRRSRREMRGAHL